MALITNPIKYTSRTFASIMNDINSDRNLKDKPNWFKRIWAGIGDVISMWLNSLINLMFLRTSYTRQAVADLCELIDYELSPASTSSGICLFYVKTDLGIGIFPFSVLRADLSARSQGSLAVSSRLFEARGNETFTLVQSTFTANAGTDILTVGTDFLHTGHKIRFTSTVTLPNPLNVNQDYFLIYVSATQIKIANSLADAFAGNFIDITTAGTGTHTLTLYSKAVTLYQQETLDAPVIVGSSDGQTPWQEVDLPDALILKDTLAIVINSVTWTLVTTFIDSLSSDNHYKIIPKSDNRMSIRFGNGTYGKIPPAFDIQASYSTGGGGNSNIFSLNAITNYAGSNSNITGVANSTEFSGGADAEDIQNAKRIAPLLLKSRDRFITADDGLALILNYGGIAQAKVIPNFYGTLSCKVVGIANGGGNPTPALRSAIQSYLLDRTVLESMTIVFDPATITPTNITAQAKMLAGYTFTGNVDKFFRLAFQLFISETGNEIKNKFLSEGINSAVTLINQIFSASFTDADYSKIQRLIENLTPRNFGDIIYQSDVFSYVQANVDGIDYLTITVFGTGFPLVNADDQITSVGTLTLTEIP